MALEENIELMNARVKIQVEHANAETINQFVRKVKMPSNTNERNTSVTYSVVILSVDVIKCRTLLDTGTKNSFILFEIVSKINKQSVTRDLKKIEMMLYTKTANEAYTT